jgi:hypothetical protein
MNNENNSTGHVERTEPHHAFRTIYTRKVRQLITGINQLNRVWNRADGLSLHIDDNDDRYILLFQNIL